MPSVQFTSIDQLQSALRDHQYVADRGLATAIYLALKLQRPLFLEGEAGVGKTEVAKVMAQLLDTELIRLQCYEGLDLNQAVYEWNYTRQMMHIRLLEARGEHPNEAELFGPQFLLRRPVLQAISPEVPRERAPVLLVDEIDRSDEEFEAFLLEVLSDFQVTVPEIGTLKADKPPVVVLTSNRTREVHDALKRRCLYLWLDHPDVAREIQILHARLPGLPDRLASQVAVAVHKLREAELLKPPGVAETLDWARALQLVGATQLDVDSAAATLGAVLKYREDADRVRDRLDILLAS